MKRQRMNDQELLSFCNKHLTYNPDTGDISRYGNILNRPNDQGYLVIKLSNHHYKQHRVAFLMSNGYLHEQIDHINHIKSDNRIINLRACTQSQNQFNAKRKVTNTSGYKVVHWRRNRSRWVARIVVDSRRKILGHFTCKHEAARAYNRAALIHYGEFAWLNPIEE